MDDIFAEEEKVINQADHLLTSDQFSSAADADLYKKLLEEYKKLLRQMRSMVKMSDITQGKLNSMSIDLERLSNIDELTNLYNRRCFNEKYEKEWVNAYLSKTPLGMLMVDIDYFKRYNDTYGHLQGDQCLKEIAGAIRATVHPIDFVARFGGEEFVVLMANAKLTDCASTAEKILENIASLSIRNTAGAFSEKVTVSIGINSLIPDNTAGMEVLLNGADRALYKAKEDGRNCCRAI